MEIQPKCVLAVDTETTGLPKVRLRCPYSWSKVADNLSAMPYVIEIGAVIVDYMTAAVSAELSTFVSDAPPSEPEAQAVHQINPDQLLERGVSLIEAMTDLARFVDESQVEAIMGYNVKFDVLILLAAAMRVQNKALFRRLLELPQIDVMQMATPLVQKRHATKGFVVSPKLSECLAFLFPADPPVPNLHCALVDIKVTVRVFSEIQRRYPKFADVLCGCDTMSADQKKICSDFLFFQQHADVLVDAVPGAGKTFLMINIIVKLLAVKGKRGVGKDGVCLLTYNRKLAEMYTHEFKKFGIKNLQTRVGVFHASTVDSLCRKLMDRDLGLANYAEAFMRDPGQLASEALAGLNRCKFVFLDEYQDFKREHLHLLQFMAKVNPQLRWFAAGDIRQTLYGEMGALPMEMRAFRNWDMRTIDATFRCEGIVVDFCNSVFRDVDWTAPANASWLPVRHLFDAPVVSRSQRKPRNVAYKKFMCGRLQATEPMLVYLEMRIQALLRANTGDTVGLLSPSTNSAKAQRLLKDIELRLSQKFGPAFVFRRANSNLSGGGVGGVANKQHAVEIQSIHASKGLTIDHVFLLCFFECRSDDENAVDWSFQCSRVQSSIKTFVAGSRARKSLTLVHNVVQFTRTMPTLQYLRGRLSDTSDAVILDQFDRKAGERDALSMDVAECVRKHLMGGGRPIAALGRLQLQPFVLPTDSTHPQYLHPLTFIKDGMLKEQLGNDMLWMLYSHFLMTYLQQALGLEHIFPCWVTQSEYARYCGVGMLPVVAHRRYEALTGRSASDVRVLVQPVPGSAIAEQAKHYARCLDKLQTAITPAALWDVARITLYPDKSLLPMFDLDDLALTPTVGNVESDFWNELTVSEQEEIKKGIEQLENGQRTSYKDVLKKIS